MRDVRIVDGEVITLPPATVRRLTVELCATCGGDVTLCGDWLCRGSPLRVREWPQLHEASA